MRIGRFMMAGMLALGTLSVGAQVRSNVLWYERPARVWDEALPVGNGRLGAMVFGDYVTERIQLNEESLWGGKKYPNADADARQILPQIQQLILKGELDRASQLAVGAMGSDPMCIGSYQSLGDLYLDFYPSRSRAPRPEEYRRELNLSTGVATTFYRMNGVGITRELFASAPDNVIVLRLRTDQPGGLTFKLSLTRERDAVVVPSGTHELIMQGAIVDLPLPATGEGGPHERFAARITGSNEGGTMRVVNNSFYVEQATQVVFCLTAATDYNVAKLDCDPAIDPLQRCSSILARIQNKPYEALLKDHVADHSALFNRVSLVLDEADSLAALPTDKRLAALKSGGEDQGFTTLLFQYGRYLLMGSSRAPGVLPANLQGVWNYHLEAPWSSDFHTNINIQMNYWPADVTNLSETVKPFSDFINALKVPGRETARKTFNSSGWTVNHLTNPYGRTSISDDVQWGIFPMAAPWLVLHQWDHYLFTDDKAYLHEEAYPTMKEAADFILGFLIKDSLGRYVTAPSNSPENSYKRDGKVYRMTYGATMDNQIIRELFTALLRVGKEMGESKAYMARLQEVLDHLPPTVVSPRYGIVQEWIEDYEENEPGHRHISPLFGLHPGTQITRHTPELYQAAIKTIKRREEYAAKGQGSSTGWSKGWLINHLARLQDGEGAGAKVVEMERERILPNLFDTHPPFQIDGNFGFTAGVAEMLLQSHAGEIQLLPAIPATWKKGEVKGLKARGNITVDMTWKEGQLQQALLLAQHDTTVTVCYRDVATKIGLKASTPCSLMWTGKGLKVIKNR